MLKEKYIIIKKALLIVVLCITIEIITLILVFPWWCR